MPKSKKRRNAKPKSRRNPFAASMPAARPKHPGYDQQCPEDLLVEEFGEEGAAWLHDEYEGPLTVADFRLEQCIRRDAFVMDDPFTGPATCTAQQISELLEMTYQVVTALAASAGTMTDAQARELAEIEALGPIDHAADGVDMVREAHQADAIYLNDRDRWDFPDSGAENHRA